MHVVLPPEIGTIIDFVLLVVFLGAIAGGFSVGIFSSIINVVSFFIAFILARIFYLPFKQALISLFKINTLPNAQDLSHLIGLLAFIVLFLAIYGILDSIGNLIVKRSSSLKHSFPNAIFGAIINVFTTAFIIGIFIFLMKLYVPDVYTQLYATSYGIRTLSYFTNTVSAVYNWLATVLKNFYESL